MMSVVTDTAFDWGEDRAPDLAYHHTVIYEAHVKGHRFVQDPHLVERGLSNYWGYNTIGFFAPHNAYSSSGGRGQQVPEFKAMVKSLHAAGLEVILDVVYNHTAEGDEGGTDAVLKGIDNACYYRLVDDDPAHYFDTTGTGNSLQPPAAGTRS